MARWSATLWLIAAVQASIHVVHGPTVGWKAMERMFASAPGGKHSIVRVDFNATPVDVTSIPSDMEFAVAVSIFDTAEGSAPPLEFCAEKYYHGDHAVGHVFADVTSQQVHGSEEFVVQHTSAHIVVVSTCVRPKFTFGDNSTVNLFPFQDLEGGVVYDIAAAISFENGYGYLPGLLWGLLPFSGLLLFGYVSVLTIFAGLYWCHRSTLLRLHTFILVVLVLMTAESLLWFITYVDLNSTGQAICCPYPPMVVASTALKVLSKLVARVLTMILCLGYGLARPHLTVPETILVTGLALCYVVSSGVLEIVHLSNQAKGTAEPPLVWEVLAVATDCCFAGWIFLSLTVTRKTLRATGQTAKLRMYTWLFGVLVGFVAIACGFTLFENAVYANQVPSFTWEYMWMLWAGSRVLNYALVVVLSVIWRPMQTSSLVAYSLQVPSTDDETRLDKAPQVFEADQTPATAAQDKDDQDGHIGVQKDAVDAA
ncbi:hypothetical protein H257_05333 [Aphanomyces astaci]|uniref:GOST seven transmembrane domain-containing protein n=1 Tax=Aphanomyces astaci TaxID=112090 RepID=W4GQX3_APHAT|nr:hypothetical protein H257_05333 [Aphanomyces astaci]ETV81741.1 hypothetical protein H257_05333 [Aphanomyces astaci]|eukprot:XP_009828478.1 hypothetical protein H257_05333 [Aphanomyces astaci]